MTAAQPALAARDLRKSFTLPDGGRLVILQGVNLAVARGESAAVMGASGSGKTTLLHLLAGIEPADSGTVETPAGRTGLVFQHHYLLPELDARENVALGARLAGGAKAAAFSRADELLAAVGLAPRARHLPAELSGGELARVALARALAAEPAVILADEPTGNLDETTAGAVLDALFRVVRDAGAALVLVTHDPEVAARADRVLRLEHGTLHSVR